ncbi:hypothetical protein QVD17_09323 [Tagetes erecta]|uniref:Uncharacterized protein n=1 Tax=Tagetes erecta TaxID=13708 RepID=A0AAD8L0D8_TARER|nr:hypothetical protein QVD17_09323 [Tagetes erecta]
MLLLIAPNLRPYTICSSIIPFHFCDVFIGLRTDGNVDFQANLFKQLCEWDGGCGVHGSDWKEKKGWGKVVVIDGVEIRGLVVVFMENDT